MGSRDGVPLQHHGRTAAVPPAPARRDRPDERLLPGAARRARLGRSATARASRSCSRSSSATPACGSPRCGSRFGERHAGRSKATIREGLRYLSLLARLRFARFGVVGASGLVVNTLLLALLTDVAGVFYVVSAVIATQASTLWNFCFTELLGLLGSRPQARAGDPDGAVLPHEQRGAGPARSAARPAHVGPRHPLRGLEHHLPDRADAGPLRARRYLDLGEGAPDRVITRSVRLRHPRHRHRHCRTRACPSSSASGSARWPRSRTSGSAWAASPRTATGPRSATARAGSASDSRSHMGSAPIEATASPLVGRSPHVLYTNVVEPILRWTFAERGYALVHAACLAKGDDAFLVTARTDTGKTTTSLRMLDCEAYSFLSDDLTLVSPAGRVLTYPKPLTISRHTLKAVKTPLLSRRERAGLLDPEPAPLALGAPVRADPRSHAPTGSDDQRGRPAARPAAEVPRGAPGAGRGGGSRGPPGWNGRDRTGRRGRPGAGRARGARDPDEQLRGCLWLPALLGDRRLPPAPQRQRPQGRASARSSPARSAAFRQPCCGASRWTGGVGCRESYTDRTGPAATNGARGSHA